MIKSFIATLLSPIVSQLNSTVYNTSYTVNQSQLVSVCQPYTIISNFLVCCDFTQSNLTAACCPTSYSGDCPSATYSLMTKWVVYVIDLPNGVVIAFELAIFLGVIFVVVKIWLHKRKENKVSPAPKSALEPQYSRPDYID
jgi:hypothetical protein